MNYEQIIGDLISQLPHISFSVDEKQLHEHASDETEDFVFLPNLVVFPKSAEEVAQVLAFCNQHEVPVTTRGAGTGLSGGALPVNGGVVLATKHLNKILDIDLANLQVTVEPGVITQVLQDAVAEHGLYYPPDPSSKGSCFIGGNISESAGGPHAVKYGTTKDYVLNLEVALADGSLIWTGANVLKNATGYNLTQLMVGSEGTLGVVTKIVLRLIPQPKYSILLLAPFNSAMAACAAVSAFFRAGITPSACEFMERDALILSKNYLGLDYHIADEVQAHLLIELDGQNEQAVFAEAEMVANVLAEYGSEDVQFADNEQHKAQLWRLRRSVAHAVRAFSIYKEEDTCVPRAALPELLAGIKSIGKVYGFSSICYGHAGDGNLHVNILKGNLNDFEWENTVNNGISELFTLVKKMKGTLSGEHGIGWVQKPYMPIIVDEMNLQLMREIKKVFDPKNILNPGKIFQ